MLIREAITLLKSAKLSRSRKVALLCSFEPLHLKLYLQALLAQDFPQETPEVIAFGYDQLHVGVGVTSSSLKTSPTLLCLSWDDIHPALSWRARGVGSVLDGEVAAAGGCLKKQLKDWIGSRQDAETYIVPPPADFLPFPDACSPIAMGRIALAATTIMWDLVDCLSRLGGRILRVPAFELSYRGLLLSGCPLSPAHSELMARRFVNAAFRKIPRKKILVTDLDGTLWQGVLGEDGPGGVECRAEGKGYPFYVFQRFLLKLKRDGVLLAFCSKNNPSDVLPVFDSLPMPLKLSDFSTFRCNWEPKSTNIRAMAKELNIGCDAFVVIDDDQAELAEIKQGTAGVCPYQTPREGREWQSLFFALQDLFATWSVSEEDGLRAETLSSNRLRNAWTAATRAEREPDGRPEALAYLKDLNLEVIIQRDAFHDPRSLELINKTNQFNLTGERFAQDEWSGLAATLGAFCWSARLKDRFGDFGTICVVAGHAGEDTLLYVRQFVLSCRAFGRGVETIMLGELLSQYTQRRIGGVFKNTGKNEPARKFLEGLGCAVDANNEWRLDRATGLKARQTVLDQTNAIIRTASVGCEEKS